MDAFEKLAKLAGASVESVGEGLPRTRAEAKALGVKRFFTGEPCPRGHVAERSVAGWRCCLCMRQEDATRRATPEYKDRARQRRAAPEHIERERQRDRERKHNASLERKEYQSRYEATPKRKEKRLHRGLIRAGDEILFAINQACRYAVGGCEPADIIPQCQEPQRSQLQALVDRIKSDPQAGKAVVGLLRTMRELRKAELAEMQAGLDAG